MSELKPKKIFDQPIHHEPVEELLAQMTFKDNDHFNIAPVEQPDTAGIQLNGIIRPTKKRSWLIGGTLVGFTTLIGWQAVHSVVNAFQIGDWLTLGWTGFIAALSIAGLSSLAKELWKLRKLRRHFSAQEQAERLSDQNSLGNGKRFCHELAAMSAVAASSEAYQRWENSVTSAHTDAEIIDLYDALVVVEQDKQAAVVVSTYSAESAALVAMSPLAIADMLLVVWRNLKMIEKLASIYGVELGYWSRIRLLRSVFINMAAAGASELAIDSGMDLISSSMAAKLSARVGQGIGVGILTARLGLKSIELLRPTPWHHDRRLRLGAIRKQIVAKVAALVSKTPAE
jgi:putative membrane protein